MPDQFWDLTLSEFFLMLNGYREKEESKSRESWQQVRTLAWYSIQPHLKKNSNTTPEKFMPLPWDKAQQPDDERQVEVQMQRLDSLEKSGHKLNEALTKKLEKWRGLKK